MSTTTTGETRRMDSLFNKLPSKSSAIFQIFKFHANVSYYLLGIPYKIETSQSLLQAASFEETLKIPSGKGLVAAAFSDDIPLHPRLTIKTNKIQKALCFIIHVYVLISQTLSVKATVQLASSDVRFRNPTQAYRMISRLNYLVYAYLIFYKTWISQHGLEYLYKVLYEDSHSHWSPLRGLKQKTVALMVTIVIRCIGIIVISAVSQIITSGGLNDNFFYYWIPTILRPGKFYSQPILDSEILQSLLKYLGTLFGIWYKFMQQWSTSILSIPCIAVYQIGLEVSEVLKSDKIKSLPIHFVIQYHAMLKRLINAINDVFGTLLLLESISGCIELSISVLSIWGLSSSSSLALHIMPIVYLVIFLLMYTMAASGSEQIDKIGEYVLHHASEAKSPMDLNLCEILALDLQRGPVGIKAWKFVITYGFIATICSTAITYAVVLLQFMVSNDATSSASCRNQFQNSSQGTN